MSITPHIRPTPSAARPSDLLGAMTSVSAYPAKPRFRVRRHKVFVLAAAAVVGAAGVAAVGKQLVGFRGAGPSLVRHTVRKGTLSITFTSRGTLESSKSEEVFCEVEGRGGFSGGGGRGGGGGGGGSGTTIINLLSEGAHVKKGDVVITLDSASMRDDLNTRQITLAERNAALTQAKENLNIVNSQNESNIKTAELTLALAEIDLRRYVEGDYRQELKTIDSERILAESDLKQAEARLIYSQRVAGKGYISQSQLEADKLAVDKAKIAVEIANEKLRVLNDYTHPRMVKDFSGKVDEAKRALDRVRSETRASLAQAEADFSGKQAAYNLEESNIEKLKRMIEKCKVTAPQDGIVVYANENTRYGQSQLLVEEGAMVRERQKLFTLPDITAMQVNTKIHESLVERVDRALEKGGLKARIRIESLPQYVIPGTVKSIAPMPDANSWFSSDQKVYTTLVALDHVVEGIRPGLTAQVEVILDELHNALSVPVSAVYDHAGQTVCYVYQDANLEPRQVMLGQSNDSYIEIKSGLNEGDEVVLNPDELLPAGPLAGTKKNEADTGQKNGSGEKQEKNAAGPAAKPAGQGPSAPDRPDAKSRTGKSKKGGPEAAEKYRRMFENLPPAERERIQKEMQTPEGQQRLRQMMRDQMPGGGPPGQPPGRDRKSPAPPAAENAPQPPARATDKPTGGGS